MKLTITIEANNLPAIDATLDHIKHALADGRTGGHSVQEHGEYRFELLSTTERSSHGEATEPVRH